MSLARLRVDFTGIRAPLSGVVAKILVDRGNVVDRGVPILVLVQDDPILVAIHVPEKHYGETFKKMDILEVRVSPDAYPESDPFPGRISTISPTIDPQSRTFELEVKLENPSRLLRPGMYVNAELVMEKYSDALLIPESALLNSEGEYFVFVVRDNGGPLAVKRAVAPGIINPGTVQIKDGLSEGDLVIAEGNSFLEPGQKVRIIAGN